MLVNSKYNKDDVVTFKLVNGDEVVAKIIEDSDTSFTIYKPTTVVPGAQGLGLIQSMFTAKIDKNIVLSKSQVMMHAPTVSDVVAHYTKTTTGIETVSGGGIIT